MPGHIRALRLNRKIRQRDLAAQIGVTDHQIRQWERGLTFPPSSIFKSLAKFFDVSQTELEVAQRNFVTSVVPGEGYTTAQVQNARIEKPTTCLPPGRLRVLDLFCGAGGLSFGLELTDHFTTVAGLDILPDRISTFRANHPHAVGLALDVHKFSPDTFPDVCDGIDVIVGGPPCQGFSSIRPFRNLTEGDKRNTLTENFLMLVSLIRPRWFIFENVVGMLTHSQGHMLQTLIDGFEAAGYTVSWGILNAAYYGVPQHRERLFIVGNSAGLKFSWPMPTHYTEYESMAGDYSGAVWNAPLFTQHLPPAITLNDALSDLPPVKSGQSAEAYKCAPQNAFQKWARERSQALTMHKATRHSAHMLEIIQHAGANISAIPKHLITSGFSSCYSRLDGDRPSTTLTVNFVHPASNKCIHPVQNRALTPREGARIQAFPDGYGFLGTRSQIVKQIGNAVPPLLAKAIGEAVLRADTPAMGDFVYDQRQPAVDSQVALPQCI